MYPKFLTPNAVEVFKIGEENFEVPKCILKFEKWLGEPVKETFGRKPIVNMNGKPMFAELAIMEHFVAENWESRWIETYGKSIKMPIYLSEWKDDKYKNQVHNPIENETVLKLLNEIHTKNNNSYSGCWDVLAWKNDLIIFAEAKRNKKDFVNSNQNDWFKAGLANGLKTTNFIIVQWDFA